MSCRSHQERDTKEVPDVSTSLEIVKDGHVCAKEEFNLSVSANRASETRQTVRH